MEFGENDVPVNSELLEKRAARFNKAGGSNRRNKMKLNMMVTLANPNSSLMVFEDVNGDFDLEECHVIGVCQDIEKPYLRLTAVSCIVSILYLSTYFCCLFRKHGLLLELIV